MAPKAVVYSLLLSISIIAASCGQVTETGQQAVVPSQQRVAPEPDVNMQYTWRATPDSLHFYLFFYDVSRLEELQRTASSLSYQVNGESKNVLLRDTLKITRQAAAENKDGVWLNIVLPKQVVANKTTLQLKLWQKFAGESSLNSAFRIELQPGMLNKTAVLVNAGTNKPVIQGYITASDSLVLESPDTANAMQVYYFATEFTPALPPMSQRTVAQPRTIQPQDSLAIVARNITTLPKEGLYLLWAGTPYAKGLLVEPHNYPMVTMAKEMLHPLIYLTTSVEREKLFKASDPKKAVDDFWLSVAGERHLARELIRTYYGRVEHANKLYTSHKPGWTTDRGMIYMVYGPPSDISRIGNTETWIYRESDMQPYTKFVFTKKQNNFTENHYELIRRREYEESWYSAVAKWRAGITDM
ncbi:GWxTD domain-containing protein [Pontibacter populi]|uniref:GWxTD domain-containing protein n=1 Tax=Pontibacter populi TaxID=890055 RepID=A0ABV1RP96_9BACT